MVRSPHRPTRPCSSSRFAALLVSLAVLHPFTGHAVASDAIVIGRSLPLTGPIASYGAAKRDGADAYIHKVNNAGGVAGRQIKLVTLDDAYEPPKDLRKLAAEGSTQCLSRAHRRPCDRGLAACADGAQVSKNE